MARITRHIEEFAFPPICARCQTRTMDTYLLPLPKRAMALAGGGKKVLSIPVCDDCQEQRRTASRRIFQLVAVAILGWIGLWVEIYFLYPAWFGVWWVASIPAFFLGLVGVRWLHSFCDINLLGVMLEKVDPKTKTATLAVRDWLVVIPPTPNAENDQPQEARRRGTLVETEFQSAANELAVATAELRFQERASQLAEMETQRYRVAVHHRLLTAAAGLLLLFAAWRFQLGDSGKPTGHRDSVVLSRLASIYFPTGLAFLLAATYSVQANESQFVRRVCWLRKTLDRGTTVVTSVDAATFIIQDSRSKSLVVSRYFRNHEKLLAECQLRTFQFSHQSIAKGDDANPGLS